MAWSENLGRVSRAFDEWKAIDSGIRAYLELTQRWIAAAYKVTWEEAKREFSKRFDPGRDDPGDYVDVFDHKVMGLSEKDYCWMLRAGVLRDAVSAFEVYAEKSLAELLNGYGFETQDGALYKLVPTRAKGQLSPSWKTLRRVHQALGNDIEPEPVKYVRSLRHLLTHQRGELRTEDQRNRYLTEADRDDWRIGDAYVGGDIPLRHERVLSMLDDLAGAVRGCDPVVWANTWGRSGFPEALRNLANGKSPPLVWALARLARE